jgi:hypothetical protein
VGDPQRSCSGPSGWHVSKDKLDLPVRITGKRSSYSQRLEEKKEPQIGQVLRRIVNAFSCSPPLEANKETRTEEGFWYSQWLEENRAKRCYRVPIVLAGEPVEAVAADHLVRIFHRDVLVAEHVQRRKPDTGQQEVRLRQGSRRPRRPTDGITVTRVVDSSGYVSFAGTNYRVGNGWRGRSAQVCVVADSVQLSIDGQIVRVHPIRHDRAKEHGAFATPNGRPRHRQDAPAEAAVKATPLRGRPAGRALTPDPLIRRCWQRRGTTPPAETTKMIMSSRYRN